MSEAGGEVAGDAASRVDDMRTVRGTEVSGTHPHDNGADCLARDLILFSHGVHLAGAITRNHGRILDVRLPILVPFRTFLCICRSVHFAN